jgi:hypothetical protein
MTKPAAIIAMLVGSDEASDLDKTAWFGSPILVLCRLLLAAGYDPTTPLEAYRGNILCLRIASIGQAANLRVHPNGTHFRRRENPPIPKSGSARPEHREAAE